MDKFNLSYDVVIANNCSTDNTLETLETLEPLDDCDITLTIINNLVNYGAELSTVNAIECASDSDLIIIICSDLQDPPELIVEMISQLLDRNDAIDSVIGIKAKSTGGRFLSMGRGIYYKFLGYTSRLKRVPNGFHGFGCYKKEVINQMLAYWDNTDINLRQCLINSTIKYSIQSYDQAERKNGKSSYNIIDYWREATTSLVLGDAVSSRLGLIVASIGSVVAFMIGIFVTVHHISGWSGYAPGVPTLMLLVIIAFVIQMLTFSILSRQIEALRFSGIKKTVRCTLKKK